MSYHWVMSKEKCEVKLIDPNKPIRLTEMTTAGGWGAKIGPGVLSDILSGLPKIKDPRILVGFESSDDACVYKVSDEVALINTIDFFPPIVDDPYTFGQIAAANSLSDVYAMGGEPKLAMNLLCFPNCLPLDAVKAILEGGNDKVNEAGATIVGGHSIEDNEPKYGLSVTGFAHPKDILSNSANEGNVLITTKMVGTGVLTTAAKADLISAEENRAIEKEMATLNKYGWLAMQEVRKAGGTIDGCTDITGFGLIGHAAEMAKAGDVTLELFTSKVPIFERALEMASMGIIPAGAYRNRDYTGGDVTSFLSKDPEKDARLRARVDCLYDPQTSGGLLIAVNEKYVQFLIEQLKEQGCVAEVIGQFKSKSSSFIELHD